MVAPLNVNYSSLCKIYYGLKNKWVTSFIDVRILLNTPFSITGTFVISAMTEKSARLHFQNL